MAQRPSLRLVAVAMSALGLGCSSPRVVDLAPERPGLCSEQPERCEDGHAYVEVPDEHPPRTLAFVLDTLSIPPVVDGRVAGFDLDDVDSGAGSEDPDATCGEARADYASGLDPGVTGVDNRLSELVPTVEGLFDPMECPEGTAEGCLDHSLAEAIASGELLIAIEVGELESADLDDRVTVALLRVSVPEGGAPALGSDGRLTPGQTFARMSESTGDGTVLDGRVDAAPPTLDIPVDFGDFLLPLDLRRVRLRFDLAEEGLRRGVIAGVTRYAESEASCDPTAASVAPDMTLEGAPCGSCNAVSVGLTFTAVPAVLIE